MIEEIIRATRRNSGLEEPAVAFISESGNKVIPEIPHPPLRTHHGGI